MFVNAMNLIMNIATEIIPEFGLAMFSIFEGTFHN